jgi:FkbM family methyltransferase
MPEHSPPRAGAARQASGRIVWRTGRSVVAALLLLTLSACRHRAPANILTAGTKLYSQHDEELLIRHFFNDERGGVFLDVGCWDWKEGSTTLYLEERLGWSGLAVDAQAEVREGYEKHRPRTKFFNFIVTDRAEGMGELFVAGQISSINEDHVEQFPGAQWYQTAPLVVPTTTLNDLLAQNGVQRIDLLSMDIEGAEPKALAGFDIQKYTPRLVVIESSPHVQEPILQYFATHGYERIDDYLTYDAVNWYFRPARAAASTP